MLTFNVYGFSFVDCNNFTALSNKLWLWYARASLEVALRNVYGSDTIFVTFATTLKTFTIAARCYSSIAISAFVLFPKL